MVFALDGTFLKTIGRSGTEPGELTTTTSTSVVQAKPGHETKLKVKIERKKGFTGRVPVEVRGLPHGVRVENIGLSGILILPEESEREIVILIEDWVKPMEVPFVVLSRVEAKGADDRFREGKQ